MLMSEAGASGLEEIDIRTIETEVEEEMQQEAQAESMTIDLGSELDPQVSSKLLSVFESNATDAVAALAVTGHQTARPDASATDRRFAELTGQQSVAQERCDELSRKIEFYERHFTQVSE